MKIQTCAAVFDIVIKGEITEASLLFEHVNYHKHGSEGEQ